MPSRKPNAQGRVKPGGKKDGRLKGRGQKPGPKPKKTRGQK